MKKVVSNGKKLFKMEKSCFKWKKVVSNGKKLFQMEKSCFKWKKVVSNGKNVDLPLYTSEHFNKHNLTLLIR